MRTTVTIDPDTEALLKEEIRRTGLSFKEILNQSIRKTFTRRSPEKVVIEPLFPSAFPLELEGRSMNRFADAWDDEETVRELHL